MDLPPGSVWIEVASTELRAWERLQGAIDRGLSRLTTLNPGAGLTTAGSLTAQGGLCGLDLEGPRLLASLATPFWIDFLEGGGFNLLAKLRAGVTPQGPCKQEQIGLRDRRSWTKSWHFGARSQARPT